MGTPFYVLQHRHQGSSCLDISLRNAGKELLGQEHKGWQLLVQGSPEEQLALPLLVMLAQQRRYIAVQTQKGPLKLISDLCDKALESLYLVRRLCMRSCLPERRKRWDQSLQAKVKGILRRMRWE